LHLFDDGRRFLSFKVSVYSMIVSIEASNGVYIVFLIIGIIGYFTIPTVAGWIIQAGGGIGNYNRNVNTAGSLGGSIAGATAGNVAGRAGRLIKSGFKKI